MNRIFLKSLAPALLTRRAMKLTNDSVSISPPQPTLGAPYLARFWRDVGFHGSHPETLHTGQEYDELLKKAGFKLARVVPTASPVSIVEAFPA